MSQSAQVHSLAQLERLHAALTQFGLAAQTALGTAALQIRHAHDTLADRLRHWQQQSHKRHEEVAQARQALSHARAMHRGGSHGCVEQELALRKAQERLREAEEKVAVVRRWQRELPEVVEEHEGRARGLSGFLESDLRHALAVLNNRIAALEAYVAMTAAEPRREGSP